MKKVIGYGISVVGLVVMALGFNIFPLKIPFLEGVASNYISGAGIVLIIVGVVLVAKMGSGKKKKSEEVPIYEGKGKNRKVVGYQRE